MKLRREAASKRVARGKTSGPDDNTIRASEMRQTERAGMPVHRRQGCLRSFTATDAVAVARSRRASIRFRKSAL